MDLANPNKHENTSGFLPIERAWMDKPVAYMVMLIHFAALIRKQINIHGGV